VSNFIWGFVIGGLVVDILWAWRTGLLRLFWRKLRSQDVDFEE
jgi:hypothetical protein